MGTESTMVNYIINENGRIYVKPCKGFVPENNIGTVPEEFTKEDWPFLQAEQVDSTWVITIDQYAKDVAAAEKQQAIVDEKWKRLRQERNRRLSETDYTQLADARLSQDDIDAFQTYRQELRDLPSNTVDPDNPTWPIKPGE